MLDGFGKGGEESVKSEEEEGWNEVEKEANEQRAENLDVEGLMASKNY